MLIHVRLCVFKKNINGILGSTGKEEAVSIMAATTVMQRSLAENASDLVPDWLSAEHMTGVSYSFLFDFL